MAGCNEKCPVEGAMCDGVEGHGVLVKFRIHFHEGHTWDRKTKDLVEFDGSPYFVPRESALLGELRREWKSSEEVIPVGAEEAVEDALSKYLAAREARGETGSVSFRFTKITTKQDGTSAVEEVY